MIPLPSDRPIDNPPVNQDGTGSAEDVAAASRAFKHTAAQDASYLVYLGIGMFLVTYAYMYIWTYTGEMASKRIRERYLRAVLRQDVAFFDQLGAGEVATRIQTDTHLIQQGISEKVASTCTFSCTNMQ